MQIILSKQNTARRSIKSARKQSTSERGGYCVKIGLTCFPDIRNRLQLLNQPYSTFRNIGSTRTKIESAIFGLTQSLKWWTWLTSSQVADTLQWMTRRGWLFLGSWSGWEVIQFLSSLSYVTTIDLQVMVVWSQYATLTRLQPILLWYTWISGKKPSCRFFRRSTGQPHKRTILLVSIIVAGDLYSQTFLVLSPSELGNEIKSDRHRTRLNKRKVVTDSLMNTREELFAGEFDGYHIIFKAMMSMLMVTIAWL